MAKLRGKAKEAFLRRMAKGRRAAGLPWKNPRSKGSRSKAAKTQTIEVSVPGGVTGGVKHPSKKRRPKSGGAVAVRPVVQTIVVKQGGSQMAKSNKSKSKKKKGGGTKRTTRRRRSKKMSLTVMHPRRVLLTNPGGLTGILATTIASILGGAAVGFVGSRVLGAQSTGVRAAATLGLGLVGGFLARRKAPGLANAWMASTVGSLGYVLGTNAGGGVAASNKADAVAQLSRISGATWTSTPVAKTGTAGMGLLAPRGSFGLLAPARSLGALSPPVSMRPRQQFALG